MAANRRFIPLLPLDEGDGRPSLVDSSIPVAPGHPIYASVPLLSDRFPKPIRLLALEGQNDPTSQVRVTMFTTDLCHPTVPYRALSYAWTRDTSAIILLNDHPFEVSVDLYQCLQATSRHVASGEHPFLWVDAICINQADDIERAAQVTIMSQIYRSCEQCIVWLGPEENDSHLVFALFGGFQDLCRTARATGNLNIHQEMKQLCSWDKYGKALEHFYKRPYWGRLWIVQEVLLAPGLFILAGDCDTGGEPFRIFLEYMTLCADDRFFQLTDGDGSNMQRLFDFATVHRAGVAFDFVHGLLISRSCKFTDGRDVVYAILGLVDPHQVQEMGISIDYTVSTNRLWGETTSQVIKQNKSLNILSICCAGSPAARETVFRAKTHLIELFLSNSTNDFDTTLAAWSHSAGNKSLESLSLDEQTLQKVKEAWQLLQSRRHEMDELKFKRALVQAWMPLHSCEPNRLPTWVPNWSDTKSISTHILYGVEDGRIIKRNFRASKDRRPSKLPSTNLSLTTLSFQCYKVDSIFSVFDSVFGQSPDNVIENWLLQPASHPLVASMTLVERATAFVDMVLLRPCQDPVHLPTYHGLVDMYSQSIRATCMYIIQFANSEVSVNAQALSGLATAAAAALRLLASDITKERVPAADVELEASDLTRHVREASLRAGNSNLQAFLTDSGFVGLAGHCVQQGDIVCIPLGCDVPLIIRPASLETSQPVQQEGHSPTELPAWHSQEYQNPKDKCSQSVLELLGPEYQGADHTSTTWENYWLIGESYVAGIMNGELLDQLEDGEEPEMVTIV